MRYQRPSSEYGDDSTDSLHGEADSDARVTNDERRLYGEPHHEVRSRRDEQTLYGEPQHEYQQEGQALPDLELLFVRMQAESTVGSTVKRGQSESSMAEPTER